MQVHLPGFEPMLRLHVLHDIFQRQVLTPELQEGGIDILPVLSTGWTFEVHGCEIPVGKRVHTNSV